MPPPSGQRHCSLKARGRPQWLPPTPFPMKVILVTGVMRSGSTWAFIVCRVLAEIAASHFGLKSFATYLEDDELRELLESSIDHPNTVAVIKSHSTPPLAVYHVGEGCAKNVCTLRDPRDCVASRRLFKPDESLSTATMRVKATWEDAMRFGDDTLWVPYDRLMGDPVMVVQAIANYLLLGISEAQAQEIADALSLDELGGIPEAVNDRIHFTTDDGVVDTATLMHEAHLSGGKVGRYKEEMSRDEIKFVEANMKDELKFYRAKMRQANGDKKA